MLLFIVVVFVYPLSGTFLIHPSLPLIPPSFLSHLDIQSSYND